MYQIVVDIFEPEGPSRGAYPILTHVFNGQTKEEAEAYVRAHEKYDGFFHDCISSGQWKDVRCVARVRSSGPVTASAY